MLTLQQISYLHPNKHTLFDHIDLTVRDREKIALIGHNGAGKSTLLRIISKELRPYEGEVMVNATPYYIPQNFGQYNHLTVAQALLIDKKLGALRKILKGDASEENFSMLNDDWTIEDRCSEALSHWNLKNLELSQSMQHLSGGEKTRVFLAGIFIHHPELILLDEPSNHLDFPARQILYDFIQFAKSTLIVVSHDRKLLNLLDTVCELSKDGIKVYGGNYDFYAEQKKIESHTLIGDIQNKEKALRKAREKSREALERRQKLDSRGKAKQEKSGVARIMINTLRNKAENSTSKMKSVHSEKIGGISRDLQTLRSTLPDIDKMKFGFDNSSLHKGKMIFKATDLNIRYDTALLWKRGLNFQIVSGERIALLGKNGAGKTTLIKLILGEIKPQTGAAYRSEYQSVYIDQEYSLPDNQLKVYEQAQQFNSSELQEHEIKIRLNRFLFGKDDWEKPCSALNGGERMRLIICCLTIKSVAPDIIILDEPTNNLDIQNIDILTSAIKNYRGTLVVVSHDNVFLEDIDIQRTISLD